LRSRSLFSAFAIFALNVVLTIADLQHESGGPSRSVPALALALAVQGVSVQLVTCTHARATSAPAFPMHSNIHPVLVTSGAANAKFTGAGGAFRLAVQECCRMPDTIIHDNGLWLGTNHAAVKAAQTTRTPLIISPRGMLTPWALKFRAWKKKLAWWLYQHRDLRSARVLHATSQDEADGFRALGLTQPIAIIPNGVELLPFSVSSTLNSQLSTTRIRTALFLSRIHPKKGLLDLVHAWANVRSQWSAVSGPFPWRFIIAGGDEAGHLAEVKAAAAEAGVLPDFEFIGEVPDDKKWDLYRSADLFVLPTKSENFGIVVAEALGSGLPVITTKGAPWAELESHRCGWWTDIGAEHLADALREALQLTDEQRREMGEHGRQLVEQKYTWPAAANQMVAVYHWLLRQGPKPDCVQTV
jgi:glycosyltransferase involved in cell wall biosynthesis